VLTLRAVGAAVGGAYQVSLEARPAATALDQQRLAAERLLAGAKDLRGDAAAEKLQQALTLWRELGDQYAEVVTLNSLANAYRLISKFDLATEHAEQALALSRRLEDRDGEATALSILGIISSIVGRLDAAFGYLEQTLAIRRGLKHRAGESTALLNLGVANNQLGRRDRAAEYLQQSLVIFRELKDRQGEGRSLHNLGESYVGMSRYEEAAAQYESALAIHRELKDRFAEATTLTSLGITYNSQGYPGKALDPLGRSLAIKRELRDRNGEAITLNFMGHSYASLGQYERAAESQEQALLICREVKNRYLEGQVLTGLGNSYFYVGRFDRATDYHEQALRLSREVKNPVGEANALSNLGMVYSSMGRYEQAVEHYERALVTYRAMKNRSQEAGTLSNLSIAYNYLGLSDRAVAILEEALTIYRETKDRDGEAKAINNLGNAYRSQGRMEKAIECYERALAVFREVKDRASEADTLYYSARTDRIRGDLGGARARVEASLEIAESLRADIRNPEQRSSYFVSAQESYQFYMDLLMSLHRADPGKGYDALAVAASARARARGLLEMLAESKAEIRRGVDAGLIAHEGSLARQINTAAQRLRQPSSPEQRAALDREVSRLEDEYQRAQAAVRRASPSYVALTRLQPLALPEIQEQLDEGTVLLEYALGAERSYLWAITRGALASYELPGREQVERAAREVYELLVARGRAPRGETASGRRARISEADARLPATARQLSHMVLGPVAAQLTHRRLVIVADGALQYLPFAALPMPVVSSQSSVAKDQDQPLVVTHEVVTLPSASALAVQRRELAGRAPAPKLVAVLADPVFAAGDKRMKAEAADPAAAAPAAGPENTRIIEHLGSGDAAGRRTVIPRLPFTRQEAERILALTPPASSFKALDFGASRAAATGAELSQYRYLHFATHGLLDSERPGLSALVLSLLDEQGRPQDGFLRAHEIYNLNLPADLVVLSACQTGLGKEVKGEGLVGLTRGFMYAGAARVMVSLWSVNDKATAELMTRFYQRMLDQGQSPAAALRAAQVAMWEEKRWQAPYNWGAFILQGDWR